MITEADGGAPLERPVRPCGYLTQRGHFYGSLTALPAHEINPQPVYTTAAVEALAAQLRARLAHAEHWAKHAMLMRSSQNEELLRILRGEPANVPVEAGPTVLRWTSPRTGG